MNQGQKRAFSLVEMLVVMAIVALLTALLFPVFAASKSSASKPVCISNLHQISIAQGLYATDFEDRLPFAIDEVSRRQQWDLVNRPDWSSYSPLLPTIPSIVKVYENYIKSGDVFRCRLDRPIHAPHDLNGGLVPAYFPRFGSSYKFTPTLRSMSVTAMAEPGKNSYAYDADRFHTEAYDFRVNDLHFDGHVAFDRTYHSGIF